MFRCDRKRGEGHTDEGHQERQTWVTARRVLSRQRSAARKGFARVHKRCFWRLRGWPRKCPPSPIKFLVSGPWRCTLCGNKGLCMQMWLRILTGRDYLGLSPQLLDVVICLSVRGMWREIHVHLEEEDTMWLQATGVMCHKSGDTGSHQLLEKHGRESP